MVTTMYTVGRHAEPRTPIIGGPLRNQFSIGNKQAWSSLRTSVQAVLALFQQTVLDARGSLLLESMAAITVFALVGGAVLSGVSTALNTGSMVEGQSVAEEIARNQMESVFNESYQEPQSTPYPTIVPPTRYAVSVAADEYLTGDLDIEMVVVTVSRDNQSILVLETLRTRWE